MKKRKRNENEIGRANYFQIFSFFSILLLLAEGMDKY
jgi:hypothetical protein